MLCDYCGSGEGEKEGGGEMSEDYNKFLSRAYWQPKPWVGISGKFHYRRVGKCNPKKCNSACCKIMCGSRYRYGVYLAGFMDERIQKFGKGYCFSKTCKYLREGKCLLHNTRKKPVPCYHFPVVSDDVYRKVRRKCSYRFVRITKEEYDRVVERNRKKWKRR